MSKMIGSFDHPVFGTYYIFYDDSTDCYGISKMFLLPVHCGYATMSALLKAKGF